MGFPERVATEALVLCGRSYCICNKFCGTKIELHHIKQKAYGGDDTLDNCIPVCFDCHADMGRADPKHPKGKRYSEEELKRHRDGWYEKVDACSRRAPDWRLDHRAVLRRWYEHPAGRPAVLHGHHPAGEGYAEGPQARRCPAPIQVSHWRGPWHCRGEALRPRGFSRPLGACHRLCRDQLQRLHLPDPGQKLR